MLFLMLFVFVILLLSVVVSGVISYIFMNIGILPPLSMRGFPLLLFFMLMVSLLVGLLLTMLGGRYSLRPLRRLTDATKEIASGNFTVHVEPRGPEELLRLAESFNNMAKELQSIETLRSDFVSNVSHEFKTPVVSIRGFAKLLKKDTLSDEQRNDYLDIIISESERLSQLSSNVLLLSKLESTDKIMEQEEFSLDEQIRKVLLLMESQFSKKNLEMDIELEPTRIVTSEELLQQVWLNIINNAVKFTPAGGKVQVGLVNKGREAVVTVSDSGIGMDAETQKHLFDKFYQEDASRSTEGNGLGLSLVKRILDLIGGGISVSSTPEEGTTFVIRIPCYVKIAR